MAKAESKTKLPAFVRETRLIMRSLIQKAAYNPRVMPTDRKGKLRKSIDKWGLVEPLVWNERTNNLVGGHQRLEQLDSKMGYPLGDCQDYEVPVTVVDLDEKEEKELNIALNNPSMQGSYDFSKLEKLYQSGVNPFASGFDKTALETRFDSDKVRAWLEQHNPKEAARIKAEEDAAALSDEQDREGQELEQDTREIPDFLRPENDPATTAKIAGKAHHNTTPAPTNTLFPIGAMLNAAQKKQWDEFKAKNNLTKDTDVVLLLLEKADV